jgi:ferritin-like metal-binding protein YciE
LELKQEKKQKNINIEEFTALVKNLIPTTLKQAEWVWSEMERLTQEYPELKEKFKEFYTMTESERRDLEKIIQQIVANADKAHQKWRISRKRC